MKDKVLDLLEEICEEITVREEMDLNLFETGLLDSLGTAELLFGIEERFGIIISPSEINQEDINTPNKIIQLVEARME